MMRIERAAAAVTRLLSPNHWTGRVNANNLSHLSGRQTSSIKRQFEWSQTRTFFAPSCPRHCASGFPQIKSRQDAESFVGQLTDEQKVMIYHSLHVEALREKYMSEIASESHYLSRFGRPTATIVDDHHPPDLQEKVPGTLQSKETKDGEVNALTARAYGIVGLKNALPFVGFGFLDNLIMILAGDYIDLTIGVTLGISTMAAAALGNTVSDVAGIASAWYVESFAEKIGIREPALSAAQLASSGMRWASNLGRALGVIIGCLLGMAPLAFLPSAEEKKEREPSPRH